MIFCSDRYSATWDTWMFYHESKYYLYYLITGKSPGEGFGVAVSHDGIKFHDYGMAISASNSMKVYLGTGSVWKSPGFVSDGLFYCNYSEWRESDGELRQTILFATSQDLIHWEKCGDEFIFVPDTGYYREYLSQGGRWDCIFPLCAAQSETGFLGYWTAAPHHGPGVGYGSSKDGLRWTALPPPVIDLGPFSMEREVEVGAACNMNDLIYLMVGCYPHPDGMGIFSATSPSGPFRPMSKNFALFSNRTYMHAYFARFVQCGNELLAHFHILDRKHNEYNRPITSLAPLKKVAADCDGILYFAWWKGNEALKGKQMQKAEGDCLLEGIWHAGVVLNLILTDGSVTEFRLGSDCSAVCGISTANGFTEFERWSREMHTVDNAMVRLLIRGRYAELYFDDIYLASYTATDIISVVEHTLENAKVWDWAI